MSTTIIKVRQIIETAVSDSDIQALIEAAGRIVTERLGNSGLSSALKTDIETWLTAHLISVSKDRQNESEKLGEASVKKTGKYGEGLLSTSYGQMAVMLDTTGILKTIDKKPVQIKVVKSFE